MKRARARSKTGLFKGAVEDADGVLMAGGLCVPRVRVAAFLLKATALFALGRLDAALAAVAAVRASDIPISDEDKTRLSTVRVTNVENQRVVTARSAGRVGVTPSKRA